jgi:mannose-1-phosphate guanylyltransferase
MAGGTGVRFWPVSRAAKPKQFLDVADTGKTFIQSTYERFLKVVPKENILIVTGDRYHDIVMEQIPDLAPENLLLEPYSRNTAPCIAYATYTILKRDPQARVVVTPSDHMIDNAELFAETISNAFDYIEGNDILMTLGVVPTRPDTNYGYIQACGGSDVYKNDSPMKVKTFTEKPDAELAKVFFDSGEFLWNSGIFFWKASVVLAEMRNCCADLIRIWDDWGRIDRDVLVERAYSESMRISIDYALMEKSDNVWVLPAKFIWSDIGSWSTLYEASADPANHGNAISLEGKSIIKDVSNSILASTAGGKLTVVSNLDSYMVIDTDKVLLVCPRDDRRMQEILSELALPEYSEFK